MADVSSTHLHPGEAELGVWAREWLRRDCHPALVGHGERCAALALLLADRQPLEIDREVLWVATLLHDIGLGASLAGTDRFEARGANAVRQALLDAGVARPRAEMAWDVIALHATSTLAEHKSAEARLANAAISIDVRGRGHESLDANDVRSVLDQWPRADFPEAFERILVDEVRANPATTRFCFMESIAEEHVDGYRRSKFLDSLRDSSSFR